MQAAHRQDVRDDIIFLAFSLGLDRRQWPERFYAPSHHWAHRPIGHCLDWAHWRRDVIETPVFFGLGVE